MKYELNCAVFGLLDVFKTKAEAEAAKENYWNSVKENDDHFALLVMMSDFDLTAKEAEVIARENFDSTVTIDEA